MAAASDVMESIIAGLLQIQWWPTMRSGVVTALALMMKHYVVVVLTRFRELRW